MSRRQIMKSAAASSLLAMGSSAIRSSARGEDAKTAAFRLNYILASCMYGYGDLADILPEVAKIGATAVDIWPMVHGSQREQLDEMGEEQFALLLQSSNVKLGCITQYKLGPLALHDEMKLAQRLGCKTIVTGAVGPVKRSGAELKNAVLEFIETMKPHLAVAEECGVTISIENHANSLIDSPDSLRYLAEYSHSTAMSIAFAPYHLPQDVPQLCGLIRELGDKISMFYAWQHGKGCMTKLDKQDELLQLPGRGTLDFGPIVQTLRDINYQGWTEIFMHPFPRGVPILDTTDAVTEEINRSRGYLDSIVNK